MAKLSAHGVELGRIAYLGYTKAFMADGVILKNSGDGWKLAAKCKPGVNPATHFSDRQAYSARYLQEHPAYADFCRKIHAAACLSKRWKLLCAIEIMPGDPDGVWSEVSDGYGDNLSLDIEEIVELCNAYKAYEYEKHPSEFQAA